MSILIERLRSENDSIDLNASQDLPDRRPVSELNNIVESMPNLISVDQLVDVNDSLNLEEYLVEPFKGLVVRDLFQFIDLLNMMLCVPGLVRTSEWKLDLLRKVGGQGTLWNIWNKLKVKGLLASNKR